MLWFLISLILFASFEVAIVRYFKQAYAKARTSYSQDSLGEHFIGINVVNALVSFGLAAGIVYLFVPTLIVMLILGVLVGVGFGLRWVWINKIKGV